MNVMQLNTDIYNSLGVLSNDESYLEEALASINQAFTELKLHREGKMDFIPAEDLLNEYRIEVAPEFARRLKKLSKHYKSIKQDYEDFFTFSSI